MRSSAGLHCGDRDAWGVGDVADVGGGHSVSRYRCTNMTAMAPSPTADATRLADSARTSPAAKTPGTLVSRWYGGRSSGQSAR